MTRKHYTAIAKILGEQQGIAEFDANENGDRPLCCGTDPGIERMRAVIQEVSYYFSTQNSNFDDHLFADAVHVECVIAMDRCETDETYTD
jgi:hypothetical protein